MRLKRLYIGKYRVLQNLDISFKPGISAALDGSLNNIDFLVGLNGSGKSSVLQAIVDIFKRERLTTQL